MRGTTLAGDNRENRYAEIEQRSLLRRRCREAPVDDLLCDLCRDLYDQRRLEIEAIGEQWRRRRGARSRFGTASCQESPR